MEINISKEDIYKYNPADYSYEQVVEMVYEALLKEEEMRNAAVKGLIAGAEEGLKGMLFEDGSVFIEDVEFENNNPLFEDSMRWVMFKIPTEKHSEFRKKLDKSIRYFTYTGYNQNIFSVKVVIRIKGYNAVKVRVFCPYNDNDENIHVSLDCKDGYRIFNGNYDTNRLVAFLITSRFEINVREAFKKHMLPYFRWVMEQAPLLPLWYNHLALAGSRVNDSVDVNEIFMLEEMLHTKYADEEMMLVPLDDKAFNDIVAHVGGREYKLFVDIIRYDWQRERFDRDVDYLDEKLSFIRKSERDDIYTNTVSYFPYNYEDMIYVKGKDIEKLTAMDPWTENIIEPHALECGYLNSRYINSELEKLRNNSGREYADYISHIVMCYDEFKHYVPVKLLFKRITWNESKVCGELNMLAETLQEKKCKDNQLIYHEMDDMIEFITTHKDVYIDKEYAAAHKGQLLVNTVRSRCMIPDNDDIVIPF